jgi:hypothetical protein
MERIQMNLRFTAAQLALFGLCGLLAITLAWLWLAPLPEYPAPEIHLRSEQADSVAPALYSPPSAEAFAEVDDRSVFNPQRTRVVASQSQGAVNTTSLPTDLSLIGVILDADTKLALFRTQSAPLAVSVPMGGTIEGWQVARIEPDRVVMHAGGADQEMKLVAGKPGGAGATAPAGVAQAINRQPQPQPQPQPNDDNDP